MILSSTLRGITNNSQSIIYSSLSLDECIMNCDWGVYKNKTKSRNNFPVNVLNENMFPPTVNVLQDILLTGFMLNFNLFSTLITGFWITSDLLGSLSRKQTPRKL